MTRSSTAWNARPGTARNRAVRRAARADRARAGAVGIRRRAQGVDSATSKIATLLAAAVTRKADLSELQKAVPFAGMSGDAAGAARSRVHVARPDLRSRRRVAPITGGSRARCTPRAFAPATSCTTCFSYHFTPAGSMVDMRRACARVPGFSRRHRTDRAAGRRRWRISSPTAMWARRRSCGSSSKRPTSWARDCRALKKALVSAEALPAALRACAARARRSPR